MPTDLYRRRRITRCEENINKAPGFVIWLVTSATLYMLLTLVMPQLNPFR
jgi:hypothetical protein